MDPDAVPPAPPPAPGAWLGLPDAQGTRPRLAPTLTLSRQPLALDTAQVQAPERLDYWREMVLRLFADVEIAAPAADGFHGSMQSRRSDVMRLTRVMAAPQAVARRHRDARADYEDCYFAVLMLSGTQRMQQDGRAVELTAGDLAVYDGARPHRLDFVDNWSELILSIPRPALNRLVPGMAGLTATRLVPDAGMGQVLRGFLGSVATALPRLGETELATLSSHALGLLGATLALGQSAAEPRQGPGAREAALLRAKLLIDAQLGDPLLDAARIAGRLGLSVRYLNRLFNAEQTSLMRYVWMRRLERCHADLKRPGASATRVLDVAMRWGFNDMSHFSRAFRERFGVSPRECRLQVDGRHPKGTSPSGSPPPGTSAPATPAPKT